MTGVTVLGSTGSIGVSTLDVLARHPDRFRVVALTANRDVEAMLAQCLRFRPDLVAMADPQAALALRERLAGVHGAPEVLAGVEGLTQAATLPEAGVVMAAIVGAAGLVPTLAAAHAGKRLLLANKEALVVAGALLMEAVADRGAVLLPIDSEHNAIFQCLPVGFSGGLARVGVERILLTASGGPFLNTPREALTAVTPEQACAHPNWDMGRKISVDSATMMNKGSGADRGVLAVRHWVRSGCRWWSTARASSTPWCSTSMARSWPNSATRTCVPPSPMPSGGRSGSVSGVAPLDLFAVRAAGLRAAGPGALSLPGAGHRGGGQRRDGPGGPQRGQRGCGGGLPRGPDRIHGHRRRRGGDPGGLAGRSRWPVKTSRSCCMSMVAPVPSRNKRSIAGSHRPP